MNAACVRGLLILAMLAGAAVAAERAAPRVEQGRDTPPLAALIPERFGEWVAEAPAVAPVLLVPDVLTDAETAQSASYDDVLMRTYRHADGAAVMVAVAYGRRQTQEIKIHRPELCYYAQGFTVSQLGARVVTLDGDLRVESRALLTQNRDRVEIVSYWIRVGARVVNDPWALRWSILRDGLDGRIPDGVLVRASSLAASAGESARELALQAEFLAELYAAVPAGTRRFLAGDGIVP
jgi:EpsI family protein